MDSSGFRSFLGLVFGSERGNLGTTHLLFSRDGNNSDSAKYLINKRKKVRTKGLSRRKFAKPELVYGLAMGGQTDSQVGWQVHASCK